MLSTPAPIPITSDATRPTCNNCGSKNTTNSGSGSVGKYVYTCNTCNVKFQTVPPSKAHIFDDAMGDAEQTAVESRGIVYSCKKCGAANKLGHICAAKPLPPPKKCRGRRSAPCEKRINKLQRCGFCKEYGHKDGKKNKCPKRTNAFTLKTVYNFSDDDDDMPAITAVSTAQNPFIAPICNGAFAYDPATSETASALPFPDYTPAPLPFLEETSMFSHDLFASNVPVPFPFTSETNTPTLHGEENTLPPLSAKDSDMFSQNFDLDTDTCDHCRATCTILSKCPCSSRKLCFDCSNGALVIECDLSCAACVAL
jgi:hypothetical protein